MRKPAGWDTVVRALKSAVPDVFLTGKLNFIAVHYIWIMGNAFFFSIIFWAMRGVDYVDALFFCSGAATQSGLNTIDVNLLRTGQQVLLYLVAMWCNPIVIHSSVVFVRLYWFEKRFKDVVQSTRELRRSKSKSRSVMRSTSKDKDLETGKGVKGRVVKMFTHTGHQHGAAIPDEKFEVKEEHGSSNTSDSIELKKRRNSDDSEDRRLPQPVSHERHIQFLENQRERDKDDVVLHIPSPGEFERGGRVRHVSDDNELARQTTSQSDPIASQKLDPPPNPTIGHRITFNEPDISRHRHHDDALPRVQTDRASTMDPTTYYGDAPVRVGERGRRNSTGIVRSNTAKTMEATPYLNWQPTVARNSFFVNLTEEQREELGGIEYRALKTLAWVLIGYFVIFHIIGVICLVPFIYTTSYGSVVTSIGQGRAWWGIFTAASAFNDLGFTLTPDSMISFQTASFALLIMTFLIIIGNTGFPIMLRFVIWTLSKMTSPGSGLWEELQFLLDHPRRCFTLLFPRAATWWLFAVLIILNALDLLFFIVLDLRDPALAGLSDWAKFLDGLFQAASTRTAGFVVVNLAQLHSGVQVSYLIMMYISVFPIAISMRRTNVYEEKSLGIYGSPSEAENSDGEPSYVGAHLQKQLSYDLWYIFMGLFIISIVEGARIENTNDYAFTIFSVLFEIVSAYGTVGLSLGYPTINASFSGEFKTFSKLIIIAMQIRGRHRGLPYAVDKAVLLPSESLHEKEAEEGVRILHRRRSSLTTYDLRSATHNTSRENGIAFTGARSHDPATEEHLRQRLTLTHSQNSAAHSTGEEHKSHARSGLGNAMFKLATAPDAIKEDVREITGNSAKSDKSSS